MTDDVADRTRILARADASQAVAADPLHDGTEQLRWSDRDPVVALIAEHPNREHSTTVVEIPGTGPIRQMAHTATASALDAPV